PAAYNLAETQFERRQAELEGIDEDLRSIREERDQVTGLLKLFRESTVDELKKKFPQYRRRIDEDLRARQIRAFEEGLKRMDERTAELEKDRAETEARLQALMKNERAFEDRRVTDVKAKLSQIASTCDLLIIPRHTLINTTEEQFITPSLFRLSPAQ